MALPRFLRVSETKRIGADAERYARLVDIGWMEVYVYQAALYCADDGRLIREALAAEGKTDTGDSDDWPQGPYDDGGGAANSPYHCGAAEACVNAMTLAGVKIGVWLGNPLTSDGHAYLCEMLNASKPTRYQKELHRFWRLVYDLGC